MKENHWIKPEYLRKDFYPKYVPHWEYLTSKTLKVTANDENGEVLGFVHSQNLVCSECGYEANTIKDDDLGTCPKCGKRLLYIQFKDHQVDNFLGEDDDE